MASRVAILVFVSLALTIEMAVSAEEPRQRVAVLTLQALKELNQEAQAIAEEIRHGFVKSGKYLV
ncbi:MAG: hypothetical protein IIA14_13195, partial [SAR324 cluster bacterium]|nr:hypothetical protein [SAR324 cluster bacterium]